MSDNVADPMNRRRVLTSAIALGATALAGACAMTSPALEPARRRFGANISMMFADVPLLQRFARAKAAGFGAVEMQFDWQTETPEALAAAARAADIEVALLNVPQGVNNEPFISSIPGAESRFVEALETAKRYCAALDCRKVNVLPGQRVESFALIDQIAAYEENLHAAGAAMAEVGVRVVAEPVNTVDRPTMLVSTVPRMAAVLQAASHPNLAIQFDIYHVAMMGDPLVETFNAYKDRIGHIQFADAPGRHEPGTGDIDFEAIFAAIDASGYDGWINGEYAPAGETEEGLAWLETFAARAG
jgi:hydroxypyruvate isomerase